jgi:soluble P-type ATPase
VREALAEISGQLEIHVVTADTFGLAAKELDGLPLKLIIIPAESQAEAKLTYISTLGSSHVVVIGNGRNDRLMLNAAAVGIAVLQTEGCSTESISAADLATANILDALELLRNPQRLVATLRS